MKHLVQSHTGDSLKDRGPRLLRHYKSPTLEAMCLAPPYSRHASFMFLNKDHKFQGGFRCGSEMLEIRSTIPHSVVASSNGRALEDLMDLSWVLAGRYTIRYAYYIGDDVLTILVNERIRVKYQRHDHLDVIDGITLKI